eukprot:2942559-Rhodomonas_salina.2
MPGTASMSAFATPGTDTAYRPTRVPRCLVLTQRTQHSSWGTIALGMVFGSLVIARHVQGASGVLQLISPDPCRTRCEIKYESGTKCRVRAGNSV